MKDKTISVGDWVRPYSSGIWRVARILTGFNEFRYSLAESKTRSNRTLVFSNRLVNNSWKRSFSTECSELTLVNPISEEEQLRVEDVLTSNPALRKAFERYEANSKPIDLIVNLGFGQLPLGDRVLFKAECDRALANSIPQGLTLDEVLNLVRQAGYECCIGAMPTTATLQLVSPNHEMRADDFILRSYRFLDF